MKRQLAASDNLAHKEHELRLVEEGKRQKVEEEVVRLRRQIKKQQRAAGVAVDGAAQRLANATAMLERSEAKNSKLESSGAALRLAVKAAGDQLKQVKELTSSLTGVQSLDGLLTALLPNGERAKLVRSIPTAVSGLGAKGAISAGSRNEAYFTKVATAVLSRVEQLMCKQGSMSQEQLWLALSHTQHFRGALLGLGGDSQDDTCIEPLLVALKRAHDLQSQFNGGCKYKLLFTQLLSLLADTSAGYTISELQSLLAGRDIAVTSYAIKQARKHADEQFAGAPVERVKHVRIVTPESTALDMSRHRFRSDVVQVNKGSFRTAASGKLLNRKDTIRNLYAAYATGDHVADELRGGWKPYGLTKFTEFMTASLFGNASALMASCDKCLDFGITMFKLAADMITELASVLGENNAGIKIAHGLHKTASAHFESGRFGYHCQEHADSGADSVVPAMHDYFHSLSDPDDDKFAESFEYGVDMSCAVCNSVFYLKRTMRFLIDRAQKKMPQNQQTADQVAIWIDDNDEIFGGEGIMRYIAHLMRDSRQKQSSDDTLKEMGMTDVRTRRDYYSKLETTGERKSDNFGAGKVSAHTVEATIRVPPETVGGKKVDRTYIPDDAEAGQFIIVFVQIFCDDSDQDWFHDFQSHACALKCIKEMFPWIENEYGVMDCGPHYTGTATALSTRQLKATGIRPVRADFDEAGMGSGSIDMKCSQTKMVIWRNKQTGKHQAIDAFSVCVSASNGGSKGAVNGCCNQVMKVETMGRDKQVPLPKTIKDKAKYASMTFNADGSITFRKSYGIGKGWTISSADLNALWVDDKPPADAAAECFQPGEEGRGELLARPMAKGTMHEEASKRIEEATVLQSKREKRLLELAEEKESEHAALRAGKRTEACSDCGKEVSARGGAMARHKNESCGTNGTPERHRIPCCICGVTGHRSPNSKKCQHKDSARWVAMDEKQRGDLVAEKTAEWTRNWVPRFTIKRDVTQDDMPGHKETVESLALQELRSGGADTVKATLNITDGKCSGILFDGMVVTSITQGSHEWDSCVIQEGFFIGMIGGKELSSAADIGSVLSTQGNGEVCATFFRPEPDTLDMGWAMKPPKMIHDTMTKEQLGFLLEQFHSAGKLPAAAIERNMKVTAKQKHATLPEQKKFVLPFRRVKSWVGYYKSMIKKAESKKGKYTKAVKAARVELGIDEAEPPDGAAVGNGGGGGGEEDEDEEAGEPQPQAPAPRAGLSHIKAPAGGVVVSNELVGRRIQYRFDGDQGSWWDEVYITKHGNNRQHFDVRAQSQGAAEWKANGEVSSLAARMRMCSH
jgi:hypothetical protein